MSLHVAGEGEKLGLLITCRFYDIIGPCAIITNVITIIVIASDQKLRRKMILHAFLAVADMINGIAFVTGGIFRERQLSTLSRARSITVWTCMTAKPWPVLFFLGGELPVLTNFLLSLELIIASFFPALYRSRWRYGNKIMLGFAALIICMVLIGGSFLAAKINENEMVSSLCSLFEAAGTSYGVFHFVFTATVYLASCMFVTQVYRITRRTKAVNLLDVRRQKLLVAINFVSLLFNVIPTVISLTVHWSHTASPLWLSAGVYCLLGMSSTLNLPVFLAFRMEFRLHFLALIHWKRKKLHQVSSVSTELLH